MWIPSCKVPIIGILLVMYLAICWSNCQSNHFNRGKSCRCLHFLRCFYRFTVPFIVEKEQKLRSTDIIQTTSGRLRELTPLITAICLQNRIWRIALNIACLCCTNVAPIPSCGGRVFLKNTSSVYDTSEFWLVCADFLEECSWLLVLF